MSPLSLHAALDKIQSAPDDRVATAAIETPSNRRWTVMMAVAIMISTFGCNNGLILAGGPVITRWRETTFLPGHRQLNERRVPAVGLVLQCLWTCLLVLPRTRLHDLQAPATEIAGARAIWQSLQRPARFSRFRWC